MIYFAGISGKLLENYTQNETMTKKIILAVIEIFGLFMIGALARKLGYIKEQEINRWSRLVLDFFLPLFLFSTILQGIDRSRMGELWIWPAIGLGQVLFSVAAGLVLQYGLFGKQSVKRRTFLHFCAFNNFTFLPVIIFRNLWGEESLSTLFILGTGSTLGVWTIGVAVLNSSDLRSAVRNVCTPNLVAVVLALIITLTAGKDCIPEVVQQVICRAGGIAIPLILILIGSSLVQKSSFRLSWPVVWIALVRLFILPAVGILLLKQLPLSRHQYEASVIIMLMPVAVSTILMTRRYGGDPEYAASTALVTTVLSMVTVPLAVRLVF